MVVTVERADDGEMTGVLDRLGRTPGVLSTALAYHHDDPIDE
jgi:nitrate reductase NapAB chaperone NapD